MSLGKAFGIVGIWAAVAFMVSSIARVDEQGAVLLGLFGGIFAVIGTLIIAATD